MNRRVALLLLALFAAVTLAACAPGGGTEIQAIFDDVADLVPRASVKIADVPIGRVRSVELTEDHRALVTMRLNDDLQLPSKVAVELRKTSVLGERYIALLPDASSGGSLEPGSILQDTRTVPELEQLVGSGSELLAAVAADKLAGAIEAGASGLDGRGHTFGFLIDDLATIVKGYERNSDDIVRLIDGLDQFLAVVGPQADVHGRAFAELSKATAVLAAEDDRLMNTLAQVRGLSGEGASIMRTHRERIQRYFPMISGVLREIAARGKDLDRLFFELAKHNRNTIRGVHDEHGQVLLDFIICGMNDSPGDPVRSCDNPPQGIPRPTPRAKHGFASQGSSQGSGQGSGR